MKHWLVAIVGVSRFCHISSKLFLQASFFFYNPHSELLINSNPTLLSHHPLLTLIIVCFMFDLILSTFIYVSVVKCVLVASPGFVKVDIFCLFFISLVFSVDFMKDWVS